MEFFEALKKRRSVRRFTEEAVPDAAIETAIDAALIAPNSSNMQAWEFYWVKSADKKAELVKDCFSQGAARTAQHLVVAVSRVDTWRRNRDLLVAEFKKAPGGPPKAILDYYYKVVPLCYLQDPFGILAVVKYVLFSIIGLFRPVPRTPCTRAQLFEVVTKSAALACENFMLAMAAQGFGTCPMEGFDECRVKRVLGIGRGAHVVMVIGCGVPHPEGIWGPQFRVDKSLVVKKI